MLLLIKLHHKHLYAMYICRNEDILWKYVNIDGKSLLSFFLDKTPNYISEKEHTGSFRRTEDKVYQTRCLGNILPAKIMFKGKTITES